jgi:hypothetical protein
MRVVYERMSINEAVGHLGDAGFSRLGTDLSQDPRTWSSTSILRHEDRVVAIACSFLNTSFEILGGV